MNHLFFLVAITTDGRKYSPCSDVTLAQYMPLYCCKNCTSQCTRYLECYKRGKSAPETAWLDTGTLLQCYGGLSSPASALLFPLQEAGTRITTELFPNVRA